MDWKEEIKRIVKDSEEYPTMEDLFRPFGFSHTDTWAEFIKDLFELMDAGTIMWDSKDKTWIYTGGPIKGEFVLLSALPAKGEEDALE